MFRSPCSLRSSTCATLIALAAAAGISRFEPAQVKPAGPLTAVISMLASASKQPQAHTYPVSLAACGETADNGRNAISLAHAETASAAADLAGGADGPPLPATAEAEVVCFDWIGAAPTAQKHSYPYAVGPPEEETKKPLRAAGNALLGDSSARRSPFARIAPVFISKSLALVARHSDLGGSLAESNFSADSVLRGESEAVSDHVSSLVRFSARGRHRLFS